KCAFDTYRARCVGQECPTPCLSAPRQQFLSKTSEQTIMLKVSAEFSNVLFMDFVYLLRDYGVPVSPKDLLELNDGLEKGIVESLDDLFVFARLVFVRKVDHMDAFERAFCFYFYDIDIPAVAEGDFELFNTKQFKEWLRQQIADG